MATVVENVGQDVLENKVMAMKSQDVEKGLALDVDS